jgi:hypothetical protein
MTETLSTEAKSHAYITFCQNPDVAAYLIASAEVEFQSPGWLPSSERVAVQAFEARRSLARLPREEAMERVAIARNALSGMSQA